MGSAGEVKERVVDQQVELNGEGEGRGIEREFRGGLRSRKEEERRMKRRLKRRRWIGEGCQHCDNYLTHPTKYTNSPKPHPLLSLHSSFTPN